MDIREGQVGAPSEWLTVQGGEQGQEIPILHHWPLSHEPDPMWREWQQPRNGQGHSVAECLGLRVTFRS